MGELKQYADALLMVRPARFGFNPETAASNAFQQSAPATGDSAIQSAALVEFDNAVKKLTTAGVDVLVVNDSPEPAKPDAVFPNNWLSTHADGTIVTYPMLSPIRRQEIREEIVHAVGQRFRMGQRWALEETARSERFLEGTGSLVLDRPNRIAYACRSVRTNEGLVGEFCRRMEYSPVLFDAVDAAGQPIYHTNVMMSVIEHAAMICIDSISSPQQRKRVLGTIESSGLAIVEFSVGQMADFSCNLLQVGRRGLSPAIALSSRAERALTRQQRRSLEKGSELLPLEIPVIEQCGGGSVRCMLCEIFLPPH